MGEGVCDPYHKIKSKFDQHIMKYKQKPEDFIVEEIADHKILNDGKYKIYTVEKKGIETFALLDRFSKTHGIARKDIGIAGIKDTHAKTTQYITVPEQYELKKINKLRK